MEVQDKGVPQVREINHYDVIRVLQYVIYKEYMEHFFEQFVTSKKLNFMQLNQCKKKPQGNEKKV